MAKRMLIDATHPEETRVVVVSGNRLEEFDYETETRRQLKGNIYLAKVTRVEPSLQAAFVDYGGNRHGFLAFNEIHPDYYRLPISDREALMAEQAAEEADEDGNGDRDVETVGGDDVEEVRRRQRRAFRNYKIQEVISRRQILLVQVTKEERGNKGAALTTYISLAGRYCVLMPNTPKGGGISRKITNQKDRKRLKAIIDDLDVPDGMAVILRTAGMERTRAEIRRDYEYLLKRWDQIREQTLESTAPAMIHEEANLIRRSIRDIYSRDIDEVLVEGDDGYRIAKDFMKVLVPSHSKRVQAYKDPTIPLFHRYQVENQIDGIHNSVVQLRSGGYIVLNPTEALVAIDVNSGRSTKERNIEETALRTNLEAAEEVARQLRLRDLAGLIVIDFIDMEENRNQAKVERQLKEAMRGERARVQLGRISPFGLLELSRQRLRPSLVEATMEVCPHCAGSGYVRSTESAALHVLRAIEEEGIRQRSNSLEVHVATGVALYILNQKREMLAEIERRYGFAVMVHGDNTLIPPDMRIERIGGKGGEEREEVRIGADAEDGDAQAKGKRRSRRRRGRSDRDDGAETTVEATSEADADAPGERAPRGEAGDGDEEAPRKSRRRGRRGGRRRSRRGRTEADIAEAVAQDPNADDRPAANGEAAPDTFQAGPDEPDATATATEQTPVSAETAKSGDGDGDGEKKPARRRRTGRRKPAATLDAAATSNEAEPATDGSASRATNGGAEDADAPPDGEASDAKATPKPRRRTRRKPAASSGNGSGDAAASDKAADTSAPAGAAETEAESTNAGTATTPPAKAPPARAKSTAAKSKTSPAPDEVVPPEQPEASAAKTDTPPPEASGDDAEKQRGKGWFSRLLD